MDTPPTTPPTPSAPSAPSGAQPPKEYIRTFEGDMRTLHEGGMPDLRPLASPPPVPVTVRPSGVPRTIPIQPPSPTPAFRPVGSPSPAARPELPKQSPIETYASDFSKRMKETSASMATVLAAEQDAAFGVPQDAPEKPSRGNILYGIAGVILLVAGIAGASIAYMYYLKKGEPIILLPTVSTPIFVDEKEKISNETPAAILQAIKKSVSHELAPHAVRLISLDSATTTDTSVFFALQLPAPGILLRNVNTKNNMAGVVNVNGTQSPFFILSVDSYGDTFAGMLSWEHSMPRDLAVLFPAYATPVPNTEATSTQATATSTPRTSPPAVAFRDEVVSNHDVRIYRDSAGRSVMLYGYWNQTMLVIARDPAAFVEILQRLATSRTAP